MRISKEQYFLSIAQLVSQRSTCKRRQAGCVLVDTNNYIKATGYNGVPKGFTHCIDTPCPGAYSLSGTNLEQCYAVHAEVNAFFQLACEKEKVQTAYLTCTPCRECAKLFANSFITKIIALEKYNDVVALEVLKKADIEVVLINE